MLLGGRYHHFPLIKKRRELVNISDISYSKKNPEEMKFKGIQSICVYINQTHTHTYTEGGREGKREREREREREIIIGHYGFLYCRIGKMV